MGGGGGGGKAREQTDRAGEDIGGGGVSPFHGRDILCVENFSMINAFSCTLNANIRGGGR